MFNRFLTAAILICAAGQYASAGVMVSMDDEIRTTAVDVESMMTAESPLDPAVEQREFSTDQATGVAGTGGSTVNSPALSNSNAIVRANICVSIIRLANAVLPRAPCLKDVLRPA